MDADETTAVRKLSELLHADCPFGNEHIARLVNYKTGDKIASCPECYDIAARMMSTTVLAPLVEQARQEGAREALRRFADSRGVNVGDEDDDYWRGYRQAQRECLHDASALAERAATPGSWRRCDEQP